MFCFTVVQVVEGKVIDKLKHTSHRFVELVLNRYWKSTSQEDQRFDCQFLLKAGEFHLGKLFACFSSCFFSLVKREPFIILHFY